MRVQYLGNFDPEHSTENHVREALEVNGHEVVARQENDLGCWKEACDEVSDFDFTLWTRTGWEPQVPRGLMARLLSRGQAAGVPTVGYHLDRWWGLQREGQVAKEMFFRADLVVTADGGHDEQWAQAGVNHVWLPPAVLGAHAAELGTYREEYASDIAFVGSWREYHHEWAYRGRLVRWLMDTYGDRFKVYEGGVRGRDLADLYQSAKVIVGDSCLAGGATRYWSDRIPETLGRGGFLIHPWVEGLDEHFTPTEHLVTYGLGDFGTLRDAIDFHIEVPEGAERRQRIAEAGREHTLQMHTYERRMEQVISMLAESGMIRLPDDRRVIVGQLRERIDLVPFTASPDPVPVVWLSLHGDVMPHGYWDQGLLDRMFDGRTWAPTVGWRTKHIEARLAEGDEWPATGGAVVVIPGRFHEHDIQAVQARIEWLDWVLLIVTSDEESLFPWWELHHPAMRIWVQYPDRPGAHRNIPVGYEARTPDETPADHARSLRWAFAGQITHARRQAFAAGAAGVPDGRLEASASFLSGLDRPEYLALLSDARWAPCPSGPESQDTFRLWEALEAGCVPIADGMTPRGDRLGTWELVAPGIPFPIMRDWEEFGPGIEAFDGGWPMIAAKTGAWWMAYKRGMACGLVDDIAALSGRTPPVGAASDLVTAIVTVSPISGHPDTSMIEKTVRSIRDRLPRAEIILACDGIRPEQDDLAPAYWEHLRRLTRLAHQEWRNVLPLIVGEHLHQAGATKAALDLVRTPTILFLEHDTPLVGEIPFDPLISAVLSGVANTVRFHHEASVLEPHEHLMLDREPVYVEGEPMLRTAQWSQRPHLASTEFYRNVMARYFGRDARTMIEDVMHGVVDHAWRLDRETGWNRFKMWLYRPEGDMKRSTHLDGRQGASKFEDRWVFAYDGPPPVGAPFPTGRRRTR